MEPETKRLNKIALLNRQPTLFRHGLNAVDIIPCDNYDDKTIRIPPLMLEQYNADHDGDQMNVYLIHDKEALKEIEEKAHLKNIYRYDSDNSMITNVRHEALQACYILSENMVNEDKKCIEVENLQDLPEDFDYWNNELDKPVYIKEEVYPYGICLLNKWMGLSQVLLNKIITKKESEEISTTIFENVENYLEQINDLNKKLLFFISSSNHCPTINVEEMINILDHQSDKLFQKLPKTNPYIGYHINEGLIDRCINNLDPQSDLYKLYRSGSRFSKQQLSNICLNIGYVADAKNIVIKEPICTNLMKGLDEETYFRTAPGSRKGIVDKADITPQSGFLERTLTMALSPVEIVEDDCNSSYSLEILIFSIKHAKSLVGKYYLDPEEINNEWKVLEFSRAKQLINRKIQIRSPMTCQTSNFRICKTCFGNREFPTPYVGVVSGQIISERITQLIMRSFHSSGSANLPIFDSVKMFIEKQLIDIQESENEIRLKFRSNRFPDKIQEVEGYNRIEPENNVVVFDPIEDDVENIDVVAVLRDVKKILKSEKNLTETPTQYYQELMTHLLNVGTPYSSFIEILLCNMFLVDENKKFWRYHPNEEVVKKFGDKNLAINLSKILGCLFQPNKKTLSLIKDLSDKDINDMTIYERLWFGSFE